MLFGLLLLPGQVLAQSTPAPDTLRQMLPSVRVEATRTSRFSVGSTTLSFDSATLAQYRAGTVADLLSARSAVYLKNYGPGQLSSISLRGTSARHTAVLWNGFNINLPSLGEADFALFPLTGQQQVIVQPGPAGATYGTGAVGGTVLLGSTGTWGRGLQSSVQLDAGSFGLRAGNGEVSFSNERVSVRTAALYREAANDFPYTAFEAGSRVRRRQENAAFRQWSLTQDVAVRLGRQSELLASAWLTDADRQIQPAMGSANNHARERDQSRRALLGYRHVSRRHESVVRAAWFDDVLNYRNDNVDSRSRVKTTQVQAEHTINFLPHLSLRLGTEVQHFSAVVDGYGERRTENRAAAFSLLRFDPSARLRLSANMRQAFLSNRRPPLTPTLGAEWVIWQKRNAEASSPVQQELTLKGNASRSYRAPTLNERYWRPGGQPNLLPESGFGYEGGLGYEAIRPGCSLQASMTAYQQLVNDWVQWVAHPTDGYYLPRNLKLVRTRGVEASARASWHRAGYRLTAQAAAAFTQARKLSGHAADFDPTNRQLPYVPLTTATFSTDQTWRNWQLGTVLSYTGYRYTDASATDFLPSYLLLNATVGRTQPLGSHLLLTGLVQGYNLTNRTYQNYAYRAMPPRSVNLSLRLGWR
ncbi:TonB-dependent receptor plug domain-containing protein [Hymenobacter sp. BT175]|uniref:TonB-dependent receptor n=1 Tax=Hymenobacter translucens TaxID=2886507 RepID=UPI001D0E6A5A|nr:TonB-dependent receptor [Hymenobacter translucens]MCC2548287.1 TonB-dependent receptor plug domain-containing protein [Hymenobacter translucens]